MRIGQGFDLHLLQRGRRLVIGGTEIPFEMGLAGHSDGDVLLHAVIDAVLGALSLGTIGSYFPSSSTEWKDADSMMLLERVVAMMRGKSYALSNLDSTIYADRPVLEPRLGAMSGNIAAAFGTAADRVSVKAKSLEGLSSFLPEPVIAASAVVALREGTE